MVRKSEMAPVGAFARSVAERVRAATESAGWSQTRLAAELGRAQSYVSVRMLGDKAWSLDDVDTIAHAIGVDPTALMLGESVQTAARAPEPSPHAPAPAPLGSGVRHSRRSH